MLKNVDVFDKFVVSFVISSLFTSIKPEETTKIICQHDKLLPLQKDEFKELILICAKDIKF